MIVQQEVMVESKEKCKREEKTLSATIEKGMPDGEDIVFKCAAYHPPPPRPSRSHRHPDQTAASPPITTDLPRSPPVQV